MHETGETDQFQLLEKKIEEFIDSITALKREKEFLADKAKTQEEELADLTRQLDDLKKTRDDAKLRIVSLLEKIEQSGI